MLATSLAVLMAWAQWALWDFGTKQICHNSITGDHRVVYGNGAVFSDGPFTELIPHPDDQDKAVLLGPGDDETRPFHTLDECGAHTPTPQQRGGFLDWKTARLDSAAGEEGTAWVSELQSKSETLALELTGPAPLRLLFTRYEAPTTVGDKPVSLWVGFGRLVDYAFLRLRRAAIAKTSSTSAMRAHAVPTWGYTKITSENPYAPRASGTPRRPRRTVARRLSPRNSPPRPSLEITIGL